MSRRWGFAAALVVIGGLTVGLAFALRSPGPGALRSPGPGVPRPLAGSTQVAKLRLSIPRGFDSYAMPLNMGPGSPIASQVITNFRVPADTTIDRVLNRWSGAQWKFAAVKNHNYGPPSNEVALRLDESSGPGCIGPCPPLPVRLHLPLGPNQPWFQERLASGAPGYRDGYLRFDRHPYYVMYWIGPDAPANDRFAVLRALRSIRPRRATSAS